MAIPSPYNFVPLSEHIFFPDWADKVSMDVPFSDGISGVLKVRVTAKTSIYIRNGGDHPDRDECGKEPQDGEYTDFYRVCQGGAYAIPGTSLKGMLRNVVEIASYSKIVGTKADTGRVSDHRYAVRDLQNRKLYSDHITETIKGAYRPRVKAAWLSGGDDGEWRLFPCSFARVEQKDLEEHFQLGNCALGVSKTSEEKYGKIVPYTQISFDCGDEIPHEHSHGNSLIYRKVEKETLGVGKREGIIVLTGQPSPRNGNPGRKHMEFIFFDRQEESVGVSDEVKKDFVFAHSELGENRKPNDEWTFWEKELKKGKDVPVFVLMNDSGVLSMGLALMYRFPYKNSIHETIAHTSKEHLDGGRLDLGETIFGRVENTDGLRGRVSVETFTAEGNPQCSRMVRTVLGAPKPTYYPNYVKQDTNANGTLKGDYKTYMDSGAEIRGWKRYIIRTKESGPETAPTDNVATEFRPLPEGTSFVGTIHVHNLRPEELGALVWAITWGGKKGLRHSLGMGKPYGFGSVSLELLESECCLSWCDPKRREPVALSSCRDVFVERMNSWWGSRSPVSKWDQSEAIKALRAMADPESKWENEIRYPVLGQGPGANEFVNLKRASEYLPDPIPIKQPKTPKSSENTLEKSKPATKEKLFLADIPKLSLKQIEKRIKSDGLNPQSMDESIKTKIYKELKNKFASNAMFINSVLKDWK